MANIFFKGDRVQYNSKSRHGLPVEGEIEDIRDTTTEPLQPGREPQSRYLATVKYTDPLTTRTKYAQVYCHRLTLI